MELKIEDNKKAFYQWDTGHKLVAENADGCTEVHFCRSGEETALVCPIREEGDKRVADVPNILLQEAGEIHAYLFRRMEDGSETVYSFSFGVNGRPKPEGYVYTETEVLDYGYLARRLENLEGEGLGNAVAEYLKENPIQAGATAEEAAQIRKNAEDIETLHTQKLSKTGGTLTGKLVFPTGNQTVGFTNSEDMKIFGYGTVNNTVHMRMGDTSYPFQIRGKGDRPKYNDSEIALTGDIPTDEHINSLINSALGVIENGTY